MKHILTLSIVLAALLISLVPPPAQAQDTTTIFAPSGHYSLDIPAGWIVGDLPPQMRSGGLYGETLVVADSPESLESWWQGMPQGQLISVVVDPLARYQYDLTVAGYTLAEMTDQQLLDWLAVNDYAEPNSEVMEIDGYPALYLGDTFYTNIIVVANGLLYSIDYTGPVQDIAETLRIYPDSQQPQSLEVGALSLPLESDWFVYEWIWGLPFAPRDDNYFDSPVTYYTIFPGNHRELLPLFYTRSDVPPDVDLPSSLLMVAVYPYDALFGDASITMNDAMRELAFTEIAQNELRGEIVGVVNHSTYEGLPSVSADLQSVFGGANQGQLIVVDAEPYLYALLDIGSDNFFASEWLHHVTFDESTANEGSQIGLAAPDFTLPLADGGEVSLSDYRGKIVLLNFCNSWMSPCADQLTLFQQVADERPDDVAVLRVSQGDTAEIVQDYAADHNITFPMALDQDGSVTLLYNVRHFPTSYIIDREGIIRMIPQGVAVIPEELARWIATAE